MRTPEENKELVRRYPFLAPKGDPDYDYTWTWADDMPDGWWIAFGEMMCDEIKKELVRCHFLDEYEVVQVKEKYAMLRWYDNGIPEGCKVWNIIEKYSKLSENICGVCGKPDVPIMTWGWNFPLCEDHAWDKDEYRECAEKQNPHKMSDYRRWSQYKNDEWVKCEEYIGDTANKIRRAYADRING